MFFPSASSSAAGGLKNYIANPKAENDTSGWATFKDAASSRPVDGTGGVASSTWTRSAVTPLSGLADFNWTKSANDRQGEGVSYDFTIDRDDQGKPLQIEFAWELISGTFSGSTTPSTDSDMIVYIYDVTNAVLIEPQGRLLEPAITGYSYGYRGTFQTNINSTSYRFILYTATTSASAYTLAFDEFRIGPQVVSNGAVVTDWKDANSVAAGTLITGTVSNPAFGQSGSPAVNKCQWKRDGQDAIIRWDYQQTNSTGGSDGSGILLFNIPPEIGQIDTSKIGGVYTGTSYQSALSYSLGDFYVAISTAYVFQGRVYAYSATQLSASYQYTGTGQGAAMWNNSSGFFTNGAVSISLEVRVPIAGWSSNVQMSSDSDTRVVAARYYVTSAASTTSGNPFNFETKSFDTHNAVTTGTTTWKFTAPVSGIYEVSCDMYWGGPANYGLYKNGSVYCHMSTPTTENTGAGTALISLVAGDYIDIRADATATPTTAGATWGVTGTNWVSIKRLSGPSQIAASEEVSAVYTLSANQSLTANTSTVNFDTKVWDSHNAVTTGASSWKFTAPAVGRYLISTVITAASTSGFWHIYKNGTAYRLFMTTNNTYPMSASSLVPMVAGDYIDIRIDVNQTATGGNTASGDPYSSISIYRI